jgi:hypothetical protein
MITALLVLQDRAVPAGTAVAFRETRAAVRFLPRALPLLLVGLTAVALAALAYAPFCAAADGLWYSATHDRNAHYSFGLLLSLDVRHGDVLGFVNHVHWARVWGPLHPLALAAVLLAGGGDYRLAVLPSLAGWAGAAVLAFLAARRAAPRAGNFAGAVAALLVLASPAHKAFATDIMLESLGACLTLAALYAYLAATQDRTPAAGRGLGLALTLLFFLKYNYWLLAVLGLTAAVVAARPAACWGAARQVLCAWPWKSWLSAQLRHPLNYALAALLALLGYLAASGTEVLQLGAWRVSVKSPHNLIHAAFVVLVLRLWPWWRRQARPWVQRQASPARQLVTWHVWPVVLWFLWPQRLGYFLWYLTRGHGQDGTPDGLAGGLGYYVGCLADHYHQGWLVLALALGLAGLGLAAVRRRAGGAALAWFALMAAALTIYHPTLRSRFLHSWLAVYWVLAGVGLAALLYGRLTRPLPRLRPWLAAAALAGLTAAQLPGALHAGRAPEGGPRPGGLSAEDVARAYLPHLQGARRVAVLSNCPNKFFCAWTYLQHLGRNPHLEIDARTTEAFPEPERQELLRWLENIRCERLVFIHLTPSSSLYESPCRLDAAGFLELMAGQKAFTLERRWQLGPGTQVYLWRRGA